jgi:hypothetical protein
MNGNQAERQLRAAMQSAREEYEKLSRDYDAFLAHAHQFDTGSEEMVDGLRKANLVAPQVQDALRKYDESVRELTQFYSKI